MQDVLTIELSTRSSCDTVVKALDLHPANLGLIPTGTHVSHWHQERHLAEIYPMHHKLPLYTWQQSKLCNMDSKMLNRPHLLPSYPQSITAMQYNEQ